MKPPPRPADLWLTEQIEAIAIAIAMALVLKFFVIEAYQIPTGSMQPTILGDRATGIKDRVLADKLCTMLRPPRRWEVMIFRFPHDERRLYVKRFVGLPGETLDIYGGDVWIDGQIARKPDSVNESVLKEVFPVEDGGIDLGRAFTASGGARVERRRAIFPASGGGALKLRRLVRDDYTDGYDMSWGIRPGPIATGPRAVADLDLRLTATLEGSADELVIGFLSDEGEVSFHLPREGSGRTARVLRGTQEGAEPLLVAEAQGRALAPGHPVEVVARDVDHQVVLWVDGEEWLRQDDDSGPRAERPARSLVTLSMGGAGSVEDLVLRRDIFYLPGVGITNPSWEIPPDSYFALGDNTQASYDSRTWKLKTYVLPEGEITGFWFQSPGAPDANPHPLPDGRMLFADVHGDEFRFHERDARVTRERFAPFVHRRYLLGKATTVFWPVFNPFRWKFIQ